jgi:hypothetical protein
MSGESIQKMFEEEREEGDEGWIDRFDNSTIYDEEREEYNRDEPSDSKDKWEEIGLKLCRCFGPATYYGEYPK